MWKAAISFGEADVIVCDGFVGNVALKVSEGLADMIRLMLRESLEAHPFPQNRYVLSKSAYRDFKKRIDYSESAVPRFWSQRCLLICTAADPNAIKNAVALQPSLLQAK